MDSSWLAGPMVATIFAFQFIDFPFDNGMNNHHMKPQVNPEIRAKYKTNYAERNNASG